jgi:hypothetical protein
MSYEGSLEAAGARVIAFQEFGDWQGSWVALVEYQGQRGWVQGAYGSCDHCDAFQAEFDWDSDFACEDVKDRFAQFGRSYLDDILTTEQVSSRYNADAEWDSESADAAAWLYHAQRQYGVV